jgi:glycosyltransferase involved in cell wall biosynthesis
VERPLRVVIDARIQAGVSGGVQQWVIGLANALSHLESDTEEYLFLVDEGNDQWLLPYLAGRCRPLVRPVEPVSRIRTSVRRVRSRTATLLPVFRDLWRRWSPPRLGPLPGSDGTIERADADVMHFAFQSGFVTPVPSIYQPWDLQHLHLPEFFTEQQREWRELSYRALCQQAALVIAPSEWVKRDLVIQYSLAPARIAVVNVPPATAAYPDPTPVETRAVAERLGLPGRFVYYPAQTWPHKNHIRLLEALAQLRSESVTVPLVCSGHLNEQHARLVGIARHLGIAAHVKFLGFLEPMEVQVLYRRARALVFPSLYEGWGLPIMEAFNSDLPVACSNVTSLPELVDGAALVFNPYDRGDIAAAIRRLWTDDALVAQLARRGRAVVGRYDWHRTAVTMRAHYRHVAGLELGSEDRSLLEEAPII